ncbi:MAG: hypothetical protein AB7S54_12940 [Bacteroidales bacterium]
MVTFFTFIFYFFLSLMVLGFIFRFLVKRWFRRVYRKMDKGVDDSFSQKNSYSDGNSRPKKKIIDKHDGDYVDFEEVE